MSGIMKRIGPAFIVGACIIGPGSVTVMCKTGSKYGYSMLWVSVVAGLLMAGFIALFMRFGLLSDETFLDVVRRRIGRRYAALSGITLAMTDAAFQFGNCLGVATGMSFLVPSIHASVWPVLFTAAAIVFMFSLRHLYKAVEKMMAVFLILMLGAFLINLIAARPDPVAAIKGIVIPTVPADVDMWMVGGLVATTFVLVAVIFQSYVVKAKGWRKEDLSSGITDTLLASGIVTILGVVMMMTAAAELHPKGIVVGSAQDIAEALQRVFGNAAMYIFAIGFCAAAFSSFITNSLIGDTLVNDGLGMGGKFDSKPTKIFATCVLLIGLVTSLILIALKPAPAPTVDTKPIVAATEEQPGAQPVAAPAGQKPKDPKVIAIAIGQACTLFAIPLGAIAVVVVLFDKRATKGKGLGLPGKALVIVGIGTLLFITGVLYMALTKTFGGG